MSYKVYNELPKMGTDAKALISMIYYMYNVTKEAPGAGAKVARVRPSTPDTIEAPGRAQTKKPTAKRPPVSEPFFF